MRSRSSRGSPPALPDTIVVMVAGNHDRRAPPRRGASSSSSRKLGVHVVVDEPKRISFPDRDLSILAVPDLTGPRPELSPDPDGAAQRARDARRGRGRAPVRRRRSRGDGDSARRPRCIALELHRARPLPRAPRIEDNAYYSGSLEYTSTDPWSELEQEARLRLPGKGFIEYDLDEGEHTFHHIPAEPGTREPRLDRGARDVGGRARCRDPQGVRRLRGRDRGEDRAPRRARRAAPHRARARLARAARAQAARDALPARHAPPRRDAPSRCRRRRVVRRSSRRSPRICSAGRSTTSSIAARSSRSASSI